MLKLDMMIFQDLTSDLVKEKDFMAVIEMSISPWCLGLLK